MTTPTLAERLEEIRERDEHLRSIEDQTSLPISSSQRDRRFLLRLLSRLGDEKVVEAAARAIAPYAYTGLENLTISGSSFEQRKAAVANARAALSAALTKAMEEP